MWEGREKDVIYVKGVIYVKLKWLTGRYILGKESSGTQRGLVDWGNGDE